MPRYDFLCDRGHLIEKTLLFSQVAPIEKEFVCEHAESLTDDGEWEILCSHPALRQLAVGTSFINNKIMNVPSKRAKPGHLSV